MPACAVVARRTREAKVAKGCIMACWWKERKNDDVDDAFWCGYLRDLEASNAAERPRLDGQSS